MAQALLAYRALLAIAAHMAVMVMPPLLQLATAAALGLWCCHQAAQLLTAV